MNGCGPGLPAWYVVESWIASCFRAGNGYCELRDRVAVTREDDLKGDGLPELAIDLGDISP